MKNRFKQGTEKIFSVFAGHLFKSTVLLGHPTEHPFRTAVHSGWFLIGMEPESLHGNG